MVKISAVLCITILFVGSIWAAGVCNSCGSECAPACGTRYFRSCCFNYLRKKRGPDDFKILSSNDRKPQSIQRTIPLFSEGESWNMPNDFKLHSYEDMVENQLQAMYDV
ncbi:unnamed protein product, partial [Brenthis ino]